MIPFNLTQCAIVRTPVHAHSHIAIVCAHIAAHIGSAPWA